MRSTQVAFPDEIDWREVSDQAAHCAELLTTHNPLVLDGLNLADDEVRLFAVERVRSVPKDGSAALPVGHRLLRKSRIDGKAGDPKHETRICERHALSQRKVGAQ